MRDPRPLGDPGAFELTGPRQEARLRVMVVAAAYPQDSSFAGIFVADQVDVLRRRYDVTVVAPEARGWRAWLHHLRGSVTEPGCSGSHGILRPIARTWIPRSPRSITAGYVSAIGRAFERVARNGPPDIIHAHVTYPAGFAAVTVGRRHGVPVVLTEHSGPFRAILTSPHAVAAAYWTLEHAARVIAVGPSLREELIRFAPGLDPDIVGNVVSTDFFVPEATPSAAADGPSRLLSIGLQAPQKGVDVLLRAVAILRANAVPVELVIGGDGPERGRLEALVDILDLGGSVRFVGGLSRVQVRDWLRWCDVYVSASRHETFGLAIAEALACARPVVATRSGGPEAFVEPGFGLLVQPDDPVALAGAIREAVAHTSPLDGTIGRRVIAERYGPDAFLARIGDIYGQVLAAGRTRIEQVPSRR